MCILQKGTNSYSWATPQQLDCCRLWINQLETPMPTFNGWCRRLRLVQKLTHTLLLQYLLLSIRLWSLKDDLKNYGSNPKAFDRHGPKSKIMESCILIDRVVSRLAWSLSEAQLVLIFSLKINTCNITLKGKVSETWLGSGLFPSFIEQSVMFVQLQQFYEKW